MSGVVNICVSKLAKLGERLKAAASPGHAEDAGQGEALEQTRAAESQKRRLPLRSTLSEATVCMLMDRFAPC